MTGRARRDSQEVGGRAGVRTPSRGEVVVSGRWPRADSRANRLRRGAPRLRRRIAASIALAVLATLMLSGIGLVLSKRRSLLDTMEASARTYAGLIALPLARLAEEYRASGFERLRSRLGHLMALNSEVERLAVVDVEGRVVLEATRDAVRTAPVGRALERIEDPELLAAVRSLEISARRTQVGGRRVYRVVAPCVEEWGRHAYSLVASFGYERVNRAVLEAIATTSGFLLLGLVVAYLASVPLARNISQHLEQLHEGVLRIARGEFNERVEIRSGDEIEDLANAFNAMARDLHRTVGELRRAYGELLSLDRAKEDLLANVSHELKTPLTALRGYLELLADGQLGPLEPRAERAVEVCQRNLRRLTVRIEEMMMVARVHRGMILPADEPVALGQVIDTAVETLLPRIERKRLYCSLSLPPDLPQVHGSVEHLERVFLNLVDNAIKFTPEEGFIRISAEVAGHGGREGVLVRVADSGVGIPKDKLDRVFDRFYQVDPSSSRAHGGMGLGLALVRTIVEAHGGAVWAESDEGRGATFSVWLPLRRESSGARRAFREPEPETGRSGPVD